MNQLLRLISIELFKISKSRSIALVIIFTALGLFFIVSQAHAEILDRNKFFSMGANANPWYSVISSSIFTFIVVTSFIASFFPLMLLQLEHRNNTIKLYSYLPISPYLFFLSKLVSLVIIFGCFMLICSLSNGLGLYISGINRTDGALVGYNFIDTLGQQAHYLFKLFVVQLGCLSILLVINFKITNLPLSLLTNFSLWLFSAITPYSINYFPHKFSVYSYFIILTKEMNNTFLKYYKYELYSSAIVICCLILIYVWYRSGKFLTATY